MVEHNDIKQLISAYIDGEASSSDIVEVEQHLIECSACRQYLAELKKISSSLQKIAVEDLSPDLEQKINQQMFSKKSEENKMKKSTLLVALPSLVGICIIVFALHIYAQRSLQARIREASIYLASKTTAGEKAKQDKSERMVLAQGRMKSAVDDIGDQFSTGNTHVARTFSAQRINPSQDLAKVVQYEPYYLNSDYSVASSGFQRSDYHGEVMPGLDAPASQPLGGLAYFPVSVEESNEEYQKIQENVFKNPSIDPLSTFSIDVDTASYANVRRFLNSGQLPPIDAVRIEEMINYFDYDYPQPKNGEPFSITTEISSCPWNQKRQLLMIGLQGEAIQQESVDNNLVFLIDVSGSMADGNKLPLLKSAMKLMVKELKARDRVSIVTYAGMAGLVLEPTLGSQKEKILQAIDNLYSGGSTAGGAGIKLAYKVAKDNFNQEGNNRIILATDGDFNVGVSSDEELVSLIEDKRKEGVFLTVLGFGTGNYKDSKMEQLADKGNGNYAYIDNMLEAQKVLVKEMGGTLHTIAKDVKIQIEFNPAFVQGYKLIGYENRMLAKEDFNDDLKDAGELGSGHRVTALYEIIPAGSDEPKSVDDLKYQQQVQAPQVKHDSNEMLTIKLRYKRPNEDTSRLITDVVTKEKLTDKPSDNFQFSSAVAEFGLLLRDSAYKGNASFRNALSRAKNALGKDIDGYRHELIRLMETARLLKEGN